MEEFSVTLPESFQEKNDGSLLNSLPQLHMSHDPLHMIESFEWSNTGTITPLKPIFECVLEDNEACLLEGVYKQLYPTHILGHMPRFFRKFGRVTILGDLVGSDMPGTNSNSSSVVMAFWPERGSNLSSTDYSKKSVGVVQYFFATYHHI